MMVNGSRLWSDGSFRVNLAASKEPVPQHALGKEKKDDGQDDYKQQPSNPERGWISSLRGRRLRISCHPSFLSARSGPAMGTQFICSVISRVAVQTLSFPSCGVHLAAITQYDQAVVGSEPRFT